MYIHKYIVGSETIYRITSEAVKGGSVVLSPEDWIGKLSSSGRVGDAVKIIDGAFKRTTESPKEEPKKEPEKKLKEEPKKEPEKESEKKEEPKKKKASIINVLEKFLIKSEEI